MKKSKRQAEPTREPLSRERLNELRFELRKAFLSRGGSQHNATRFEISEKTTSGTFMTFRYELCRFVVQKWVLNVKWGRKSKKTGNAVPYKWQHYATGWYNDVHVLHNKKSEGRIIGLTRE